MWACSVCTFENSGGIACEMCETPVIPDEEPPPPLSSSHPEEYWSEEEEDEDDDYHEVQMKLEKKKQGALRAGVKVERVLTAPQGLKIIRLQEKSKLTRALAEAADVFGKEAKGQIAHNQHFFIQYPFPLNGTREANTPVFPFGSERVKFICELVTQTMQQLGVNKSDRDEMLARANVIVREYKPGQHISFHCDELECDSQVFGVILLNEHLDHRGLVFKRGEGNGEVQYVMEEYAGTAFVMAHEARYTWKHGLPPVTARRVSVTVRFFKKSVLSAFLNSQTPGESKESIPPPVIASTASAVVSELKPPKLASKQQQTLSQSQEIQHQQQQHQQQQQASKDRGRKDSVKKDSVKKDDNSKNNSDSDGIQERTKKSRRGKKKVVFAETGAQGETATTSSAADGESGEVVVHLETKSEPMRANATEEFMEVKSKRGGSSNNGNREEKKSRFPQTEQIAITLVRNANHQDCKPAVIAQCVDLPALQKTAHNKLRCQAKRVFREGGQELFGGEELQRDERLFISQGENYVGKELASSSASVFETVAPSKCALSSPVVESQIGVWKAWNYPKLLFTVDQGFHNPPGSVVESTQALGEQLEKAHLSVPELRELIQKLDLLTRTEGLTWRFRSNLWDTGRMSGVTVVNQAGAWVEFKVEGKPALKGTKKRDGPLWSLEGGYNNSQAKMFTDTPRSRLAKNVGAIAAEAAASTVYRVPAVPCDVRDGSESSEEESEEGGNRGRAGLSSPHPVVTPSTMARNVAIAAASAVAEIPLCSPPSHQHYHSNSQEDYKRERSDNGNIDGEGSEGNEGEFCSADEDYPSCSSFTSPLTVVMTATITTTSASSCRSSLAAMTINTNTTPKLTPSSLAKKALTSSTPTGASLETPSTMTRRTAVAAAKVAGETPLESLREQRVRYRGEGAERQQTNSKGKTQQNLASGSEKEEGESDDAANYPLSSPFVASSPSNNVLTPSTLIRNTAIAAARKAGNMSPLDRDRTLFRDAKDNSSSNYNLSTPSTLTRNVAVAAALRAGQLPLSPRVDDRASFVAAKDDSEGSGQEEERQSFPITPSTMIRNVAVAAAMTVSQVPLTPRTPMGGRERVLGGVAEDDSEGSAGEQEMGESISGGSSSMEKRRVAAAPARVISLPPTDEQETKEKRDGKEIDYVPPKTPSSLCKERAVDAAKRSVADDVLEGEEDGDEMDEDEENDEAEEVKQSMPQRGEKKIQKEKFNFKGKNAYQAKRGVIFTDDMVLFAGTVWPSTYFTCVLELDGNTYTSAAQFVMSEQARIFGDTARIAELMAAGFDPAPHKAFDHKAPKTGKRRLKGFDAKIWGQHRDRIMWRATYQKFLQNRALQTQLISAKDRMFVEATDDPFWGVGFALNRPEARMPSKWTGGNWMGQLLTDVCCFIRTQTHTEWGSKLALQCPCSLHDGRAALVPVDTM